MDDEMDDEMISTSDLISLPPINLKKYNENQLFYTGVERKIIGEKTVWRWLMNVNGKLPLYTKESNPKFNEGADKIAISLENFLKLGAQLQHLRALGSGDIDLYFEQDHPFDKPNVTKLYGMKENDYMRCGVEMVALPDLKFNTQTTNVFINLWNTLAVIEFSQEEGFEFYSNEK